MLSRTHTADGIRNKISILLPVKKKMVSVKERRTMDAEEHRGINIHANVTFKAALVY